MENIVYNELLIRGYNVDTGIVDMYGKEQKTELRKSVSIINIGKLQINMTQHSVYKDGKEILLTNTEFKMLYYLASNKGMALSKDQIYNYIWNGYEMTVNF